MFAKIFALFALFAVALAAPKPAPEPQLLTYSTGFDYGYPAVGAPVVSPYAASPFAYSAYPYNTGAYFVR